MPASPPPSTVVPAQLGFLTIFNPSLGSTDETIDDQIVYYASVNTQSKRRRHRSRGKPTDHISQDERNERLRQIGLAQGMVEFSRGFSGGKPVDTIETEKTRVVLHELEPGWWILASIDLTKIPLPPRLGAPPSKDEQSEHVEYSSRELKPAVLLMQDLLRAHSVFLLHHAASLSALFVKAKRQKFISILGRYWDLYLSTWDVMLHGNPASNVFGGIKIAACGELGVGVGEEDRGSGEREVLEGFVDRVEGLADLIVSKFGSSGLDSDAEPAKDKNPDDEDAPKWLGTGEEPGAEDGVIFLGVGALSKKSLRDVTYWMEDLYTWGENAYGVKDSPTSTRQARRTTKPSVTVVKDTSDQSKQPANTAEPSGTSQSNSQEQPAAKPEPGTATPDQVGDIADEGGMNKFMSYLKMGYGTHWTLGGSGGVDGAVEMERRYSKSDRNRSDTSRLSGKLPRHDSGYYLIGLMGDVEDTGVGGEHDESREQSDCAFDEVGYNSRVLLRTLTVELEDDKRSETEFAQDLGSQQTELTTSQSGYKDSMDPNSRFDSQDRNKTQKMRVVVYVNRPFIYTFIFRNRTDSLAWDGLYRSLHHQLAPLRKPLTASTAYRPGKPDVGTVASHIFDLVWDPKAMTIHSTIPNIPTPLEMLQERPRPIWSRAEAIGTHNQILNTYIATLTDYTELERTCKTSRGWWIVWTRIMEKAPLPPRGHGGSHDSNSTSEHLSDTADGHHVTPSLHESMSASSIHSTHGPGQQAGQSPPKPKVSNEIFLIRRAGEHLRGISSSYAEGAGWADGASRLAQGIGVDTHRYIEGLLSLGR
ncbi:hypothetical protein F4809DRAFT_6558 [Biscogniauxia mediterranea]|nr:hypothetical protein F4809DRAFT_6558 [Biscogniauxia mediterranea]